MQIQVKGHPTYCYTGGKAIDPKQPTVVMVHGVLNDHSVWILQSRYLANHGWNVLAVDLPGHCRSQGEAPASVEAAADFIAALLDTLQIERVALVGHSFGSLIALEAAAKLTNRVTHLVMVGTAFPMKVSDTLLDAALNDPAKGIQMINVFSRSTLAAPPSALGPGTWVFGSSSALNQRVLKSNSDVNVFHRGFKACDDYANGLAAIERVTAPILFVLGGQDQMTPVSGAQSLINHAKEKVKTAQIVVLPVGHHQMTEAPEAMLAALKGFLNH